MEKVLFLITNLNVGGTEKALINMLNVMNKEKYDVDVYLLEKKGQLLEEIPEWVHLYVLDDFIEIKSWIMDPPLIVCKKLFINKQFVTSFLLLVSHVIFKINKNRTIYYKCVLHYMKNIEKKYDVAIAYSGPFDFVTSFILNKTNARKKIQWIHFDVSKFNFNVEFARQNYPKFDEIVVVSQNAKDILLKKIPEISKKTQVVHNFLPHQLCFDKANEFDAYGKNENFKILTVGRLSPEKGQIIIPEIIEVLIKKGIRNFTWYIVGDGIDRGKIEDLVENKKINNYIVLCGTKTNPFPYYKDADLYVQTSIHEGYCITIAEALLFNNYVISTDVAGAKEQIKDNINGKIIEYNHLKMADAIYNYMRSLYHEN